MAVRLDACHAAEVRELIVLGFAEVVQHRPGRALRDQQFIGAEAFQGVRSELPQ